MCLVIQFMGIQKKCMKYSAGTRCGQCYNILETAAIVVSRMWWFQNNEDGNMILENHATMLSDKRY